MRCVQIQTHIILEYHRWWNEQIAEVRFSHFGEVCEVFSVIFYGDDLKVIRFVADEIWDSLHIFPNFSCRHCNGVKESEKSEFSFNWTEIMRKKVDQQNQHFYEFFHIFDWVSPQKSSSPKLSLKLPKLTHLTTDKSWHSNAKRLWVERQWRFWEKKSFNLKFTTNVLGIWQQPTTSNWRIEKVFTLFSIFLFFFVRTAQKSSLVLSLFLRWNFAEKFHLMFHDFLPFSPISPCHLCDCREWKVRESKRREI